MELFGTICGILGAFLVALKMGNLGYPCFFFSSLFLLASAIGKGQKNFIALQGTFLAANIVGLFNYV